MKVLKGFVATAVLLLPSFAALAFAPVPKESAKWLKVTRGKSFSSGAVFVNGKYLEPPYVVERWGTGIRINGKPVTGQVIDWNEFLKTQRDVKVTRQEDSEPVQQETAPAEPKPSPVVPSPAPAESKPKSAEAEDVTAKALDALFDDDPKPEKSVVESNPAVVEAKPKPERPPAKPEPVAAAAKPRPAVTTYSLAGDFVINSASREKLNRINKLRTKIDSTLRAGGFICFGDRYYSPSPDDSRMVQTLLEELPDLQKNAKDEEDFIARVGKSSLGGLLDEEVRRDLYRNRIDYRKLQERCRRLKSDGEIQKMLNSADSSSLF